MRTRPWPQRRGSLRAGTAALRRGGRASSVSGGSIASRSVLEQAAVEALGLGAAAREAPLRSAVDCQDGTGGEAGSVAREVVDRSYGFLDLADASQRERAGPLGKGVV